MNSELELLIKKYDIRVFKTFCRDIIYNVLNMMMIRQSSY